MTTDENDARYDEFIEQLSNGLYGDHKQRAIAEFSTERLKSFYVQHPAVMRPAVDALQEGRWLQENDRFSAALVFYVSAIELLFKSTLLRPVIYGLVHHEGLAEVIVNYTLGQTGYDRYENLLKELFSGIAGLDLAEIRRDTATQSLLGECKTFQKKRNDIIHRGTRCLYPDAEGARIVTVAVYDMIVVPMLSSLGLKVIAKGKIVPQQVPRTR